MRPVHMSGAVEAPPALCAACIWNVVHRNAPGAISAIAFTVMPVRVSVRFICPPCAVSAAMRFTSFRVHLERYTRTASTSPLRGGAPIMRGACFGARFAVLRFCEPLGSRQRGSPETNRPRGEREREQPAGSGGLFATDACCLL